MDYRSISLYVTNLAPQVTEATLFSHFNQNNTGGVVTVHVCRDAMSRRSMGYGYVNFNTPDDAQRALDQLNYEDLEGRPVRVMWCMRNPDRRKSGENNIFIRNLDKAITTRQLHDTFSSFGDILSAKIAEDNGRSKGFGFVQYRQAECAKLAIETLNGKKFNGKVVYIAPFIPRDQREKKGPKRFTNLYVKHIQPIVDDEALRGIFEDFGGIQSVRVMYGRDGDPKKSKCFGFVNFEEHEKAQLAIDALHEKEHPLSTRFSKEETSEDGETQSVEHVKTLYVQPAMKRSERHQILQQKREDEKRKYTQNGGNLYVKNLHENVSEEMLHKVFEKFGTIASVRVMRGKGGRSRGFGFVNFQEESSATTAVTKMRNFMLEGKPLWVGVARSKDQRRQFAADRRMRMFGSRGGYQPQLLYAGGPGGPQGVFPQYPYGMPRGVPGYHPSMSGQYVQYPVPAMGQRRPMPANAGGKPGPSGPAGAARGAWQGNAAQSVPTTSGPSMPLQEPSVGTVAPTSGTVPYTKPPGAAVTAANNDARSGTQDLATRLAEADDQQRKQLLGERLYPRVRAYEPERAGKITGMLLGIEDAELMHLLEHDAALKNRVDEAVEVLNDHQTNTTAVPASAE